MVGALYYRLDPLIDDHVYLDEKDDEKLIDLLWETHIYIYENRSLIEKIAEDLL